MATKRCISIFWPMRRRDDDAQSYAALRKAESVARPVGSAEWLEDMEARTGMILKPGKQGPKPRILGLLRVSP